VPPFGGVLYPGANGLGEAVEIFEAMEGDIRPAELQSWARRFSEEEFARKMSAQLAQNRVEMHPRSVDVRKTGVRLVEDQG
jgi:hypothetical protein